MVSQPGRSLPDLPRNEGVTPRRGYNGEPWANDLLQGNFSDHAYQYMDDTEKPKGARKKHSFSSMSTVRLNEKLSDRMRLLEDVRDNSCHNVNTGIVDGAKSLLTTGRDDSSFGRNSSGVGPQVEDLTVALGNSSLATPHHTPHAMRDWQNSSPLNPTQRGSFTPSHRRYTDRHSLSPNQERHQETLRQMIQSNMSRINKFHLEVNEAKVKRGLDVSADDIDLELYKNQNLIASTDPSLLASDYSERIRMLTNINENLELNLEKKRKLLAVLSQTDTKTTASQSEPRRSARLKNQAKKSLNNSFLWY